MTEMMRDENHELGLYEILALMPQHMHIPKDNLRQASQVINKRSKKTSLRSALV